MKTENAVPKVSIIIPVYNTEKYLRQCLDSVVEQTLQGIEIIIVNDGSSDGSARIIDEYANQNENIKVITQSNKGLYGARRVGLSAARGEYIGWVDSDDFVDRSMYEVLYCAALENQSDLVYCDYAFYPKRIKTKEKWFRECDGKLNIYWLERNSQPWNKIVKRNLIQKLHIADMFPNCYDEAYLKLMLVAKNPVSIPCKLYFYRMGQSSMSSNYKNINHYAGFIKASEALLQDVKEMHLSQYMMSYFEYRIIYYTLVTMIVCANAESPDQYMQFKIELEHKYPNYRRNPHLWNILKQNFGTMKAFVIKHIVPCSYPLTRVICKLVF